MGSFKDGGKKILFFLSLCFLGHPLCAHAHLVKHRYCGAFDSAYFLPEASLIDCGRRWVIGYGDAGRKTLWVAEQVTKMKVEKFQHKLGHRHFEKEADVDPRDFNFANLPNLQWHSHKMLPSHFKMWAERDQDISREDDPLGSKKRLDLSAWFHLEQELHRFVLRFGRIYLITGPLRDTELSQQTPMEGHLRLPSAVWLAVYVPKKRTFLAQICQNYTPAYCYSLSLEELEKKLGFSPFPVLKEPVARHEIYVPQWIK